MLSAKQVKAVVRQAAPEGLLDRLRPLRDGLARRRHAGDAVQCPLCGSSFARFSSFNGRPGARCQRCGALERHRLAWLYLERSTDLFTRPQRVLHVAPEQQLRARLAATHEGGYVYGDVADPEHHLDVLDLPFADGSFDVVICSHVFEHVQDDARAMSEVRRVLADDGWGLLDAPVDETRATTLEDPTVTSAAERRRVFKQWDHVRLYGRDYGDRLAAAGFSVELDPVALPAAVAQRHGVRPGVDRVYVCRKRPAS